MPNCNAAYLIRKCNNLMKSKRIIKALEHGPKSAIEICRFYEPEIEIVRIEDAQQVRAICRKLMDKGIIQLVPQPSNTHSKRVYPPYELVAVLTGT